MMRLKINEKWINILSPKLKGILVRIKVIQVNVISIKYVSKSIPWYSKRRRNYLNDAFTLWKMQKITLTHIDSRKDWQNKSRPLDWRGRAVIKSAPDIKSISHKDPD